MLFNEGGATMEEMENKYHGHSRSTNIASTNAANLASECTLRCHGGTHLVHLRALSV